MLPAGTVTFLFTDIEGSTPLWDRKPQAMRSALARHDAILRSAIEANDGTAYKTVGDSFQAAFAVAPQALAAALAAQRALSEETWGETGPLRVRMGLHTGSAEPLERDYAATHTLNRVARVMSAAYGDQILLSRVTADLVRQDLPSGVSLRDLGDHRLKGLSEPERLFQIVAPDLRKEFPLLPTRIQHPNNLPPQLTSFVGREAEKAAIIEKLLEPGLRLLTLTGAGGTGKSRLALQVGQQLLKAFPDGVFFVPLAPIREVHLVMPSIGEALGLREPAERSHLDLLKEYFAHKRLLLILDNFEQILDAGPLLIELLQAAPQIKLLVTSRTLLRLAAEHGHPVSPLSLLDENAGLSLDDIEANEAVQLFVQRARAVQPDFRLNSENAAAVAEICRRLDGLPLAIELAAARCRLLTPQKMLEQLGTRLPLLVGGARDLPGRHQTMRAAIDWSHELLSVEEQILFCRLAVFAGGSDLDAVEAVCGLDGIDVVDGLESLLDKNLLVQSERMGEPRFWMYDTVREYGLEKLVAGGEGEVVRQRHARYYIVFANRFSRELNRLETELGNLRAILRWSIDSGKVELGYRLTNDFWFWGNRASEGRHWLAELLALPGPSKHLVRRGYSVFCAGLLAIFQGDLDAGRAAMDELQGIADDLDYTALHHLVQFGSAYILMVEDRLIEALAIYSDLEKKIKTGMDWWTAPWVYFALIAIMILGEDYEKAQDYVQSALEIFEEHDRPVGITLCIVLRGFIALSQGDIPEASSLFHDGLQLAKEIGFQRSIGSSIRGFAGIALATGDLERSARLFGAAEALIKITGALYLDMAENAIHERNLTALRARLDEKTFATAWQEGMKMEVEEAISYALPGPQAQQ